jgi:hypothetical protein
MQTKMLKSSHIWRNLLSESRKVLEVSIMGFRVQPNLWQCGPYALKHALIMLGVLVDEGKITKVAGSNGSGTNEKNLARAARRFGCELREIRITDPTEARRELTGFLRSGIPCLLCVHEWKHWVAVVKEERGQFLMLDSEDAAVLSIVSWKQLKTMWEFPMDNDETPPRTEILYDLYPLSPHFRVQVRANFSLSRARYLRRPENRELAQQWDEYLADLLKICKPRNPLSEHVVSLGEFLRRHESMIVDQVAYWHGKIEPKAVRRVLRSLRFVADTHGLVVHLDEEKRAIAGMTALLALWASSRYGVGPVYDARPAPHPHR